MQMGDIEGTGQKRKIRDMKCQQDSLHSHQLLQQGNSRTAAVKLDKGEGDIAKATLLAHPPQTTPWIGIYYWQSICCGRYEEVEPRADIPYQRTVIQEAAIRHCKEPTTRYPTRVSAFESHIQMKATASNGQISDFTTTPKSQLSSRSKCYIQPRSTKPT